MSRRLLLVVGFLFLGLSCQPPTPKPVSVEINLAYSSDEDPVSEQGCTSCQPVAFVSAWGSALTVIVDSARGFSLSHDDLESVTLVELPGIEDPTRGGWLVTIDLTPYAQEKADSFAAAHPHSLVLVRVDGVPTSAHDLDDWDLGLIVAAYRQLQDAKRFVATLDLPVVEKPADPAETEAIRGDLRSPRERLDAP
jgi:hypothetical protein